MLTILENTQTPALTLLPGHFVKELRAYPVALKRATVPLSQAQGIPVPGISVIQKPKVAAFHGRRLLNLGVDKLKTGALSA